VGASLVSPLFVGRQTERAELIESLKAAVSGPTQFVVIGGEAGVGKSRLVAELVDEAQADGVRVLSGQCVQLGTDGLPFAPLVDALRVLARSMPRDAFDQALGPARGALLRLLPNLDPQTDDVQVGPIVQGSQLLELVLGMIERLAEGGPVLIVLEDLHWADQSTLDLLAYLVRALRGVPVLVVGTFRSDELNRRHPLRSLLLAWQRGRSARILTLARFSRDEVADQLGAILGRVAEPAVVDTVFERSEGNAFLAEEMLGIVLAGGEPTSLPESYRDVLLSRVDGLGPDAQRLLAVASVGGRWVAEPLLLRVSGLDEDAAFVGLREAVEQNLLVVDDAGRGYSFRHTLARDAVYDDLLPGERGRLHAAYGEALSSDPGLAGDDRGTQTADLAHHWYVALDLPKALPATLEAATRALERFAPADALRQLERCLQIWPRVPDAESITGIDHVELLRRTAEVALEVGEIHRAGTVVGEALDELGSDGDAERRALLMERQGFALMQSGRVTQSMEILRAAADLLPDEGDSEAHATVFAELASSMFRAGHLDEADQLAGRAAATAEAAGAPRPLVDARLVLAVNMMIRGDLDEGLAMGRANLDLALSLGYATAAMRSYINMSDTLERLGRSAAAAALAHEGRLQAEQSGYARSTGAFLAGNEAESLMRLGRYGEAESLASTKLASDPEGVYAATLLDVRAAIAVRQGRYDAARQDVVRARRLVGDQAELQYTRAFAVTEAMLRLADGDEEAALGGLRAELESPDGEARYDWMLAALAFRAHADRAQHARDRGQPVPVLDAVFGHAADRLPVETPVSLAFRATSTADAIRAEGTNDPARWAEVAEQWRRLERPYELAESLLREAEARALTGDRSGAQRAAVEAHTLVDRIGADPIAGRIVDLARNARLELGAEPVAENAHADLPGELDRFGLTQREREVLALVADGYTNPQIAKRLFISPKTVSVHVSKVLAKLGVSSRVEAAILAERLGTTQS
jgi:DNA-binding CsgD family transcriptional regulator/tetratricopeptide (TPR) repeat protein